MIKKCEYCEINFEYTVDDMYRTARRGDKIPIYTDCKNCKKPILLGKQYALPQWR